MAALHQERDPHRVLQQDGVYTNYQLLITAIRGPVGGSVNSMQIAEVELIGAPVE